MEHGKFDDFSYWKLIDYSYFLSILLQICKTLHNSAIILAWDWNGALLGPLYFSISHFAFICIFSPLKMCHFILVLVANEYGVLQTIIIMQNYYFLFTLSTQYRITPITIQPISHIEGSTVGLIISSLQICVSCLSGVSNMFRQFGYGLPYHFCFLLQNCTIHT